MDFRKCQTVTATPAKPGVLPLAIDSEEGSRGAVWHSGALGGRPDIQITDKMICNAERLVMVSLAGIESQRRYRKSSVRHYHAHSDYQSAVDLLFRFSGGGEEVSLWMKLLALRTRSIIESPIWWPVIVDFSSTLLNRRKMTGKEAEATIRDSLTRHLTRKREDVHVNATHADAHESVHSHADKG
jgi:hypothetical protein